MLVCADGATSQLATKLGYCTEAPRGVCSRAFVAGGTHNAKFDGVCFYPKWSLPGYAALFRCACRCCSGLQGAGRARGQSVCCGARGATAMVHLRQWTAEQLASSPRCNHCHPPLACVCCMPGQVEHGAWCLVAGHSPSCALVLWDVGVL